MTRREAWLSAVAVFALALVVRAIAASFVPFPVPEDTAYYYGVARNLVEGRGLISDALWSYQTGPLLPPPRPAFEVWLPLPTFLAALPMLVFGTGFHPAQVASVVEGALVPVLAWRLAADVAEERQLPQGRARTLAVGAGVVAALFGPLVLHSMLPDSTMPFTVLVLAACLLMTRLLRRPATRLADLRLVGLGAALGLAALTRNEAIWVALVWAGLAWFGLRAHPRDAVSRLGHIAIPALVAAAIYAPWAIRDWMVFGSPLPGQAATNALSITGFDIFAYRDLPTLSRYLAVGPVRLIEMRVDGFLHNLLDVLLITGVPVAPLGLLVLPWMGRALSLRPLLLVSLIVFWATTLIFPVSTTWGTFLHAAGPVHVLLLISCLLALDAAIVRVGRWRGWTRPVAWLGPALAVGVAMPILFLTVVGIGGVGVGQQRVYGLLEARLGADGISVDRSHPVLAATPIWTAEAWRVPTLGLPDESPDNVLDLARRFGAHLLVVDGERGSWPGILDAGAPGSDCFREVNVRVRTASADPGSSLEHVRVFEITCS